MGQKKFLTIGLEDKVNLHKEVHKLDVVFTRGVEVKLGEGVCLVIGDEAAVGWGLESAAQVPQDGALGVAVDLEGDGAVRRRGNRCVEVDRRLVAACRAQLVGRLIEAVPVERTV